MRVFFLLFVIFSLSSCSTPIDDDLILKKILERDDAFLRKKFYKVHDVNKVQFKAVVSAYGKDLKRRSRLKKVVFKEAYGLEKNEKHGFYFLDANNNFISSITFKYVALKDGSKKIAYINFRNSGSLPSLKFPFGIPIRNGELPMPIIPNLDSLESIYPITIHGKKFYYDFLLPSELDSTKRTIIFNTGNLKIKNNLKKILSGLDELLNLDSTYVLQESVSVGLPTTNVIFDPSFHTEKELNAVRTVLQNVLKEKIRFIPSDKNDPVLFFTDRSKSPRLYIGFFYAEKIRNALY